MQTGEHERLQRLHALNALRVAQSAMGLVADLDTGVLAEIAALRDLVDQLEISAIALANDDGASWAAMGDSIGVRRQSLHRRTARKVADLLDAVHLEVPSDGQIRREARRLANVLISRTRSAVSGVGTTAAVP